VGEEEILGGFVKWSRKFLDVIKLFENILSLQKLLMIVNKIFPGLKKYFQV
jgi:hypothetical protein